MKELPIVSLVIICFLAGCNMPTSNQNRENQIRDSIEKVKVDSAQRSWKQRDSIANLPWKIGSFVDNFGDPTGDKFIEANIEGVFSNSATSGSPLYIRILLEKDDCGIFLHEYGRSQPAEKFIGGGTLQLKNEANEVLSTIIIADWNEKGGLLIDNKTAGYYHGRYDKLKKFIFESGGKIKAVISEKYGSEYKFTIDMAGCLEQFNKLDSLNAKK
jgi:hypothetical protein